MSEPINDSKQQKIEARGRRASFAIRCLGRMPFPLVRATGALLGWVAVKFAAQTKEKCLENIDRCFPNLSAQDQQTLANKSMIETAKTAAETAYIWVQPYRDLKKYIRNVTNLKLLQKPVDEKQGLLLLVPHIGNWEALGSFVAEHCACTAMYQPASSEAMNNLIIQGRTSDGLQLTPTNRQGVAAGFRVLKKGDVLTVLPDQVPNEGAGEWSEFFGQPVFTMTLVHKLIQKTNCAVVFAVAWRTKKGFNLEFMAADSAIYSEDSSESLLGLNKSIENCVHKFPEQYQWEYNRFKRQRRRKNKA